MDDDGGRFRGGAGLVHALLLAQVGKIKKPS